MKKNLYLNHLYAILCCASLITVVQDLQATQLKNAEHLSRNWDHRSDVQESVKKLKEVSIEWDSFVRKIYNAYAPYTIGDDVTTRKRFKDFMRFLSFSGNIEGVYALYINSIGSTLPYQKNMTTLKNGIIFYYFDQQLKMLLGWKINVTSQVSIILETLCDDKRHPDFERVTQFNKSEADALLVKIESAIHAAMATIPGGLKALKQ